MPSHTPIATYGRFLWRYLRPHWLRATGLATLLFASIALQIALPQILRRFIDLGGQRLESSWC